MPDPTTDPCPECNGDGESDQSPLLPCPICLGSRVDPNAQRGTDAEGADQ